MENVKVFKQLQEKIFFKHFFFLTYIRSKLFLQNHLIYFYFLPNLHMAQCPFLKLNVTTEDKSLMWNDSLQPQCQVEAVEGKKTTKMATKILMTSSGRHHMWWMISVFFFFLFYFCFPSNWYEQREDLPLRREKKSAFIRWLYKRATQCLLGLF